MNDLSQPPPFTDAGESEEGQRLAQGHVVPWVPSSFPDFTLLDSPRTELGKNFQRYPQGEQLEGTAEPGTLVMR